MRDDYTPTDRSKPDRCGALALFLYWVTITFGLLALGVVARGMCGCGAILESSDSDVDDDCDDGNDSSTPDEPDVSQETDLADYLDVLPDEVVHLDAETIEASDETEDDAGVEDASPDETNEADGETVDVDADSGSTCSGPWVGSGEEGVHHVADMVLAADSYCSLNSCHDPFPYFEILVTGPLHALTCSDCHGYGTSGPRCSVLPGLEPVAISIDVRCVDGPCSWDFSVSCPCTDL
jgi:hypothetical protein